MFPVHLLPLLLLLLLFFAKGTHQINVDCNELQMMGQFMCPDPARGQIDSRTQQLAGCTKEGRARVWCIAANEINCTETGNATFTREVPCKWTNGYHLDTTLLLSVFLGMFGVDRFYLGYPGIGLLKFCTLGGMFLGQLIDIVLIALQVVGPADGSAYVIPYYGAGIHIVRSDNTTYRLPRDDW
ncbi:TM2 domain-containing protein CG10795 [Drosophila biarmipes]|uniref:TM2 domain-containing protein CG10795 n=1 Tax=Drosophila biarmipes TaxID=125945 RepID=UPI0007E8B075|nr:TM2 domain-containing protein CG10795 [Drosophila biarmipes]